MFCRRFLTDTALLMKTHRSRNQLLILLKLPDWNQESFLNFVRSNHSAAAISDAAVCLLWTSFHFYAHHPFPCCDAQGGRVDYEAFRRAGLLLVFQHNDLLGTRELEYHWRIEGDSFFHRASLERLFRSIAAAETEKTETAARSAISAQQNSVLSDVMDVLVMLGPHDMNAIPSVEQLEMVARRLLAVGPAVVQRAVRRKEVSILMSLLLRMRLSKDKWRLYYNLGDFVEANMANDELTEALVNSLAGCEGETYDRTIITFEQLLGATDLVPNLLLRFYQLWGVLFQPSAETEEPSRAPEVAPIHIGGAISLFAPQIEAEKLYFHSRHVQQDERIALEKAKVTPDAGDTTIIRLVRAFSRHSSAHVVMFTGHAVGTTRKVVVGAYFPGASHTESENGKRETQGHDAHLLFQVQPRLRLLCSKKPNVPLRDLIHTERKKVPLEEIQAMNDDDSESFDVPYSIGHPTGQGASLRIDPREKTMKLTGGDEGWHNDVQTGEDKQKWEVVMQNVQMNIFVTDGVDYKQ